MLYDCGWLKSKDPRADLIGNLTDKYGSRPKGSIAQHDCPVSSRQNPNLELKFLQAGLDPNAAELGRWVPKATHDKWHSGKGFGSGGPFLKVWREFFDDLPEATAEEILDFLGRIRSGEVTVTLPDGSVLDFKYP
jgi:hypothetical protein